jgi:hypothetical protein
MDRMPQTSPSVPQKRPSAVVGDAPRSRVVIMDYDRAKHLDLLQSVISRMASNSFALKGWSVTVTAALLGLAAKDSSPGFAIIAFYPALAFWGLDAYYLRQERRFRALYDAVRKDVVVEPFAMDPKGFDAQVASGLCTLLAGVVAGLHLPIIAAIIPVLLYTLLK